MGYIRAITHLLTMDPNFQRDIQVVGFGAAKKNLPSGLPRPPPPSFVLGSVGHRFVWVNRSLTYFMYMHVCIYLEPK